MQVTRGARPGGDVPVQYVVTLLDTKRSCTAVTRRTACLNSGMQVTGARPGGCLSVLKVGHTGHKKVAVPSKAVGYSTLLKLGNAGSRCTGARPE